MSTTVTHDFNTTTSHNLATSIAKLRKQANLSQEQLGDKLGVSRQAVSKWESGEALPELERLLEMSTLFDVSIDAMLVGVHSKMATTESVRAVEQSGSFLSKTSFWVAICIIGVVFLTYFFSIIVLLLDLL
jgi:transcriptional regulator with XRE-family HTH domain